eukprot:scaffold12838_cov144-Isochrysis_galbana.AAC.5
MVSSAPRLMSRRPPPPPSGRASALDSGCGAWAAAQGELPPCRQIRPAVEGLLSQPDCAGARRGPQVPQLQAVFGEPRTALA